MAIEFFEITELPDSNVLESKIEGNNIKLNKRYPIALQSKLSFIRKPLFQSSYVSEKIKWKTIDETNNTISNVSNMFLVWKDLQNTSLSSDSYRETILNSDIVNFLEILRISSSSENFKIKSIEGAGSLKYKTNDVLPGQTFLIQDLFYMNYEPLISGGGDFYFKLIYQLGKNNIIDETNNYEIIFDISSFSTINEKETSINSFQNDSIVFDASTNYTTTEKRVNFEILDGYSKGKVNLEVKIESPFLELNDFNKIELFSGSSIIEKKENETFNIIVDLNELGKRKLYFTNIILNDTDVPKIGKITFTIIDINGSTIPISSGPNKQLSITTNL